MNRFKHVSAIAAMGLVGVSTAYAADTLITGRVTDIDEENSAFTVIVEERPNDPEIVLLVDGGTEYRGGLEGFADLRRGSVVSVEYYSAMRVGGMRMEMADDDATGTFGTGYSEPGVINLARPQRYARVVDGPPPSDTSQLVWLAIGLAVFGGLIALSVAVVGKTKTRKSATG